MFANVFRKKQAGVFGAILVATLGVCMLSFAPAALAAPDADDPAVVYDAAAHAWRGENLQPEDVMVGFDGVIPGDSLVQEFTLRVQHVQQHPVSVFMRRDVPNAPADAQSPAVAELDAVHYTAEVDGKVVSQGPLGDLEGGNVPLAQFSADGEVDARITLTVPVDHGNEFQQTAYALEWLFVAQEDGGAGSNDGSGGAAASSSDLLAKTGDDAVSLAVPFAIVAAGALSAAFAAMLRRRRNGGCEGD